MDCSALHAYVRVQTYRYFDVVCRERFVTRTDEIVQSWSSNSEGDAPSWCTVALFLENGSFCQVLQGDILWGTSGMGRTRYYQLYTACKSYEKAFLSRT